MNERIPSQFTPPVFTDDQAPQHDRPTRPTCPSTGTFKCPPRTTCDTCAPLCVDIDSDAPERDAEAVEATPAAAAPPSGPEPLAAGTYAVYDDTAGGYVLVIGTREGETHRKHLPGHLVKMAEKMAGGSPLAMLFGA